MRKEIFKTIAKRIKERCDDVKFIDLWNEHIAEIATSTPWPLPAVFISFEPFQVTQRGMWQREADITVNLHIITRMVPYTGGAADSRIDKALEYFDLIERINNAMQGLAGDCFARFQQISSTTNHNHAELIENIESWKTHAVDISAQRIYENLRLQNPQIGIIEKV